MPGRWMLPLLVCSAVLAGAEPAKPGLAEQQVVGAVLKLAMAMEAGDAAAMSRLLAIDENLVSQREGRELFTRLASAQKRLQRAAQQKFGADGQRLAWGYAALLPEGRRQKIEQSRVFIVQGGTQAMLLMDGDCNIMRVRRDAAGQWQVVLDPLVEELSDEFQQSTQRYGPDHLSTMRLTRYRRTLAAVDQTAQRVENGQYATVAQAESALQQEVDAAWAELRSEELMERRRRFRR